MKNFVQPGQFGLTVTAPANVVSGQLVIVGEIAGVCAWDATAGAQVEISPEGVFNLTKVASDTYTQGAKAMADPATGNITAAGAKAVGWIMAAAAAGSTTALVRLCPAP
jgi:predicted RecA/RadA family phage recombinase